MAILPDIPFFGHPVAFPRFTEFPLEIRLKVYHFAINSPPSQIVAAKLRSDSVTLFPRPPRFPPSVLALMHTSHEARTEMLSTFHLLRFPIQVPLTTTTYHLSSLCPERGHSRPAPKGNGESKCSGHLSILTRRWQSRGSHLIDVRSDIVFFGRWATRDLMRAYGKDFTAAMVFALGNVRLLAISMQSWKEAGAAWLTLLRVLEKVKEIVFVKELGSRNDGLGGCYYGETYLEFVDLSTVAVVPYEFPEDVWRARILADLEKQKKDWPTWKVPKLGFKGLVDCARQYTARVIPEGLVPDGLNAVERSRKLRDEFSWRSN